MKFILASLCIALSINAAAQSNSKSKPKVYTYVEQMPEATVNIGKFISETLQSPPGAVANNIAGKVIVKFFVDSIGKIEDVQVIKSVAPSIDSEAVRVVNLMPDWKPGHQQGKPVNVFFTLPINFQLTDPDQKH